MSRVYLISETTGETEDYSAEEFEMTFDPKVVQLNLIVKDKKTISLSMWLIDAIKVANEYNKLIREGKDVFIVYSEESLTVLEAADEM